MDEQEEYEARLERPPEVTSRADKSVPPREVALRSLVEESCPSTATAAGFSRLASMVLKEPSASTNWKVVEGAKE